MLAVQSCDNDFAPVDVGMFESGYLWEGNALETIFKASKAGHEFILAVHFGCPVPSYLEENKSSATSSRMELSILTVTTYRSNFLYYCKLQPGRRILILMDHTEPASCGSPLTKGRRFLKIWHQTAARRNLIVPPMIFQLTAKKIVPKMANIWASSKQARPAFTK